MRRKRTALYLIVPVVAFVAALVAGALWLANHPSYIANYYLHRIHQKVLASTSGPTWTEKTIDRAVVRFESQDTGASEVLAVLPGSIAQVQGALKDIPDRFYVFVFADASMVEQSIGYDLPDGFNGAGFGSDMLFVLSPAAWPAKERAQKPVDKIVTHELTHDAVAYIGGSAVPKWLTEGLAVYVADQVMPSDEEFVAQQLAAGKRYSLRDIHDMFTNLKSLKDVGPGYALSGSVVKFMVDRYSFAKVQQVLVELGSGRNLDEALTAALGTDSKGLEAAWTRSVTGGGQ